MYSLPPELKQPGFPATMAAITDGHFQPWLVTGLFPATLKSLVLAYFHQLESVSSGKVYHQRHTVQMTQAVVE